MPKPSKQIIVDAIIKEIEKGKGFKVVFGVIRSKSKLAESTFASYWKTANEQHWFYPGVSFVLKNLYYIMNI